MPLPGEKPELNVVGDPGSRPAARAAPRRAARAGAGGGLALVLPGGHLAGALAHPGRRSRSPGSGLGWVLATQTPMYEADILLQVDAQPQNSSLMMGMGANVEGALSGPQSRVATEIEVMQSRRLLGVVVDDLHLDVSASPRASSPRWAAPSRCGAGRNGLASPLFGSAKYAWGGERIKVTRFDVPAEHGGRLPRPHPRRGRRRHLRPPSMGPGQTVAGGQVGKPLTWNMARRPVTDLPRCSSRN